MALTRRFDSLSHDSSGLARSAHGILSPIAFLFFVSGGIALRLLRTPRAVTIHGWWQAFSTVVLFVGFGCAVWLCQLPQTLTSGKVDFQLHQVASK
jgi:hypothetical protein